MVKRIEIKCPYCMKIRKFTKEMAELPKWCYYCGFPIYEPEPTTKNAKYVKNKREFRGEIEWLDEETKYHTSPKKRFLKKEDEEKKKKKIHIYNSFRKNQQKQKKPSNTEKTIKYGDFNRSIVINEEYRVFRTRYLS